MNSNDNFHFRSPSESCFVRKIGLWGYMGLHALMLEISASKYSWTGEGQTAGSKRSTQPPAIRRNFEHYSTWP
jgi:hypothetical protein